MSQVQVTQPLLTGSNTNIDAPEEAVAADADADIFEKSVRPHTITAVGDATGPAPLSLSLCCGFSFYPTRAVITTPGEDGKGRDRYLWNARGHRKMRFPAHVLGDPRRHPMGICQRLRVLSYEPHNVTWWNCLIGEVANTLWVVNGLYAVWPEIARDPIVSATNITYYTGVVGAGMFVITGYLGWVEAINHTHGDVRIPSPEAGAGSAGNARRVHHSQAQCGRPHHPLGFHLGSLKKEVSPQQVRGIIKKGYPIVEDVVAGSYSTARLHARVVKKHSGDAKAVEEEFQGRPLDSKTGEHISPVRVESLHDVVVAATGNDATQGYVWWMNHPDLRHIGVFNALVYFVATIVFFIPALAWYPMEAFGDPTLASTIFWIYVLQIIPSVMFIYTGFAAMAEVSGAWTRPAFDAIGWWISFFNFVGAIGFLSYAVLALPAVVGEPGCCDVLLRWGAAMATFWGSCAFWVAGLLQWVEFSSEHPIALGVGTGATGCGSEEEGARSHVSRLKSYGTIAEEREVDEVILQS